MADTGPIFFNIPHVQLQHLGKNTGAQGLAGFGRTAVFRFSGEQFQQEYRRGGQQCGQHGPPCVRHRHGRGSDIPQKAGDNPGKSGKAGQYGKL